MTKKDYIQFAAIMRATVKHCEDGTPRELWEDLTDKMAELFAKDNAAFDRSRFLEACYRG